MERGITAIVTAGRQSFAADSHGQFSGRGQPGSQEHGMSQRTAARPARRDADTEPGRGDRGSLTLMLAVLFVALIGLAGIVIDGGAKLSAAENAAAIAQEAARAGAGIVNQATAHANGSFVVSQSQAIAAANAFLASAPANVAGGTVAGTATAGPNGTDEIVVNVTVTVPTRVLSIIGIGLMHARGTATANLVSGVTGPGQ